MSWRVKKLQKKELFEHHQENLEKYTEQLSELTELDVEEMQKQRTEIINYTRVTSRFMNQILVAVEEGLEGWSERALRDHSRITTGKSILVSPPRLQLYNVNIHTGWGGPWCA